MDKRIPDLSQYITPETAGIIWFTDGPLKYSTPGVYEFNYLLDGLLVKSMEENSEKINSSNYFLGDSFGLPFFIGHCVIEKKSDFDLIHNHFKLSESFIKENSTVYIYNKSQNTANINVLKELKSKYKMVEFKHLNI